MESLKAQRAMHDDTDDAAAAASMTGAASADGRQPNGGLAGEARAAPAGPVSCDIDDEILAAVLAESQREYFESAARKRQESGDESSALPADD
jgi:hypothetical protein